jgi:PAS domain S-box-containing protein
LILTDDQDKYPLGLYLQILEDPGGELTINDVTAPEFASRFAPSREEVPNFGFTDSAYWVRLDLRNESQVNAQWLLELGFANMQFVDLYTPDGNGFSQRQTGALRPSDSRDIRHPRIVFSLPIPPEDEQTVYLRFQSGASMTFPFTLWEPWTFSSEFQREQLQRGIFYGVMLGLLVYNLFLLFSLRDKSYLYLVILLSSMLFFEAVYTGYMEVYLAPKLYYLKPYYQPLFMALLFCSPVLFADSFLEAKERLPNLHRVNLALVAGWGLLVILIPFITYAGMARLMVVWAIQSLVAILTAGIVSWRRGFHRARFFNFAMVGLIITFFITLLVRLGSIPSTLLTENAYHFGIMWMALSLSIALADRINLLKEGTERANRDLQDSERRLTQTLEAMPVGVAVYGPDQRPTYVNRRTFEILSNPGQALGPDPSFQRTLEQTMAYYSFRKAGSEQPYSIEQFPIYLALQGEAATADDIEADLLEWRVPLEVWASPVFDHSGNVESAVVAFQDITKRKQSELALRASEAHFRAIVENIFDGIAFLGRDRKVLYVSPSYAQLNGINAEELIGRSGIGTIHPDDQTYVAEVFQTVLQQPGERVSAEYRIRHQDGSWVWVETRAMNLLDDPDLQAVVLNSRNITERKATEVELTNYRHYLEQLVEERTQELETINAQLSNEVAERTALEGLLQKRIQWMSVIGRARQEIRGTADLQATYTSLTETIRDLLDANTVFLVCWNGADESGEMLCRLLSDEPALESEAIRTCLPKDSPLRLQIEQGNTCLFSAGEVDALPAPLQQCLAGDAASALLLIPMSAGEQVSGMLGMAVPQRANMLAPARSELISKIALDLAALNEYAQFLDQSRALIAADERNRLARDLHDSVTQVLFSASLVAEVLPQMWRRDPDKAQKSLEELRRLTRGALAEMRTMLLELRPTAVAKTPLHDLLGQLTEAVTSRAQLPFRLFLEKTPLLPEDVHTGFYRIAQEALNNVTKHAQASQVSMVLQVLPTKPDLVNKKAVELRLEIIDDGVGFSSKDGLAGQLGLGIMYERAADIDATLTIDSHIGEGTNVTLSWCGPVGNDP